MSQQRKTTTAPTVLRLVRDDPSERVMRRDTELRLRNQLVRAFAQRFGAEHGLRLLVSLATRQMLEAGTSRANVRAALRRLLDERVSGRPAMSPVAGARAAELMTLMLEWSDRTEERLAE